MSLSQVFHVVLICYVKHNAHNKIHFIGNISMSKVYNESCFKGNQRVSRLFCGFVLYITINCKMSSHAVFYDYVSTCRLVVLKLEKHDNVYTSFR